MLNMGKKVLVISPTPTHPQDAGNRQRIFALLNVLKELRCDIYFCYMDMEPDADIVAMEQYWEGKFIHIKNTKHQRNTVFFSLIIRKLFEIFRINRIKTKPKIVYKIDDWYDNRTDLKLKEISTSINPDVVLVEYVFLSKSLLNFGSKVLKVIDTHDVFSDRHKKYVLNGMSPEWFSTTAKEEKLGLERADVVLAIQEKEAEVIKNYLGVNKRTLTVPHFVSLNKIARTVPVEGNIVFVASKNKINLQAFNFFKNEVLPKILSELPSVTFKVAGSICDTINEKQDDVMLLGAFDKAWDIYCNSDLAINPMFFGTGLKVKNIEAMGYGLPLVTTTVGAYGMEDGIGKAFLVADDAEGFARAIINILTDSNMYMTISNQSYEYAASWNQKTKGTLQALFT